MLCEGTVTVSSNWVLGVLLVLSFNPEQLREGGSHFPLSLPVPHQLGVGADVDGDCVRGPKSSLSLYLFI